MPASRERGTLTRPSAGELRVSSWAALCAASSSAGLGSCGDGWLFCCTGGAEVALSTRPLPALSRRPDSAGSADGSGRHWGGLMVNCCIACIRAQHLSIPQGAERSIRQAVTAVANKGKHLGLHAEQEDLARHAAVRSRLADADYWHGEAKLNQGVKCRAFCIDMGNDLQAIA